MKILISGATGLVGTELRSLLKDKGHEITVLTRSQSGASEKTAIWNPSTGDVESDKLEGHDAVVHLAGESIMGRWTEEKKIEIENSRVIGTRLLAETLAGLKSKPSVIVSASAIGYYGDRGEELLTEDSEEGDSFLADVAAKWEDALKPATDAGIRAVMVRLGIVLSSEGGALEQMLLPFKLGVGGRIGDGEQYWSWIAIDDVVGAIYHCIVNDGISGPVNLVSPNPVTNNEFTDTMGEALGRPTILPLPAFAARGLFGEMAEELMLASTRVVPEKLLESGYKFQYTDLKAVLNDLT